MEEEKESEQNDQNTLESQPNSQPTPLSKNAQKKLLKQQKWEAKKAEKKAQVKEQKMKEAERKRKEWEERLSSCASEEERLKLIESRRELRKERMEKRAEEKEDKVQRLSKAKEFGQNIVIDLEFADLMTNSEIHSLVQQVSFWLFCVKVWDFFVFNNGFMLYSVCAGCF
jgi:tRNA (guanine9-N1)-methyltransferase